MRLVTNSIIIIILSIFYLGCANKANLSGGPKDITPPQLDTVKSTPNYQTNFFPVSIKLYFNEWINLKNKNQILVSPPLNKKPNISYRGKHVTIEFNQEDTLRPNTTYSINFGSSIVDFTEGNPVPNFVYIFSTGNKIDSLEIKGKVLSAYDNKPVKDVTVLLYENSEDSIVTNSLPYYFSITDKNGNFKITHIKEGYFKVFALKDGNSNYFYDLETEEIGYIETLVLIKEDSIIKDITIPLFLPTPSLRIMDKSIAAFGKIKIEYNRKPDSVRIIKSSVPVFTKEIINDSLLVWYDNKNNPDSINLILKNEQNIDTVILKKRKSFSNPFPLVLLNKKTSITLHPDKELTLEFNQAFKQNDSTKFSLYFNEIIPKDTSKLLMQDSTSNLMKDFVIKVKNDTIKNILEYSYSIDTINSRKLFINSKWNEGRKYKLQILPGYLTGFYGNNNDTINLNIIIDKKENYSNLICHLDSMDFDKTYIILLKKNKDIVKKRIIKRAFKNDLIYIGLKPGKYSLEIIVDDNENGRWDGGDYYKKKKAEKIYLFELNELKKNWDQEEEIMLNTKTKDDIKK